MHTFKTISEKTILYNALSNIMRNQRKETELLEKQPESQLAKHWLATYEKQIAEISAWLIELEELEDGNLHRKETL